MPSEENTTQAEATGDEDGGLPPEMVRQIAERVYQLLKQEARIGYERYRPRQNHRPFGQGGQ
jgi:hypothetical protein